MSENIPLPPQKRPQGQHLTDEERETTKANILAYVARTGVLYRALLYYNIHHSTFQYWLSSDESFAEKYDMAKEAYKESLVLEAARRGRDGVSEVVLSGGRPVTDNKGRPLMVTKYSDSLLASEIKRLYESQAAPLFATTEKERSDDLFIHIPWEELTLEEQSIIEQIGRNIEKRRSEKLLKRDEKGRFA